MNRQFTRAISVSRPNKARFSQLSIPQLLLWVSLTWSQWFKVEETMNIYSPRARNRFQRVMGCLAMITLLKRNLPICETLLTNIFASQETAKSFLGLKQHSQTSSQSTFNQIRDAILQQSGICNRNLEGFTFVSSVQTQWKQSEGCLKGCKMSSP